jgi:hypothetical protein
MPWNHFSIQRNNSFQQFFDIITYDCQSILYCSENACPTIFNNFFQQNLCKRNDKFTLSIWRFCGDCYNNYSLFQSNTSVLVYPLAVKLVGKLFVNRRIYSTDCMLESVFGSFSRYFQYWIPCFCSSARHGTSKVKRRASNIMCYTRRRCKHWHAWGERCKTSVMVLKLNN